MGCISEFGVLVKTFFVWMHAVAAPSGCTFADLYAYVVGSVAVCEYACAHRWWNDVLTVCVCVGTVMSLVVGVFIWAAAYSCGRSFRYVSV